MSKWYVSQIGRREHYALPAHLHRIGQLGLFATDIWAPWAENSRALFRPEKLAQRFEASMGAALLPLILSAEPDSRPAMWSSVIRRPIWNNS